MASIQKRGNSWSVVYRYKTEDGKQKQKWENFNTQKEAKIRKTEVENLIETDQFIAPSNRTLSEYLKMFVEIYGAENWSPSTYARNVGMINHYINPIIGEYKLQEFTTLMIEHYYAKLKKTPAVDSRKTNAYVSDGTILCIHKLLKTAFKTAKLWDLIYKDPYEKVKRPKHEYAKRDIWDTDTILQALHLCDDPKLTMSIHLSFACSLRLGEVLGLQWKNVHVDDKDIEKNDARVDIVCQLEELSKQAIESSNVGEIFFEFPRILGESGRQVKVLKTPKTKSSIRTVWVPHTLARILRKWKEEQQSYKEYYGETYYDYDLVVCLENGRPCSHSVIRSSLNRLIEENDLPPVVFHSFRHASTTYKLKLNHGDIKATQGDTGHAQADMITDLYAHILDEDRKNNAVRFDESFYKQVETDPENNKSKVDVDQLIEALKGNPELLQQVLSALK